jgi:hypothetical protein
MLAAVCGWIYAIGRDKVPQLIPAGDAMVRESVAYMVIRQGERARDVFDPQYSACVVRLSAPACDGWWELTEKEAGLPARFGAAHPVTKDALDRLLALGACRWTGCIGGCQ